MNTRRSGPVQLARRLSLLLLAAVWQVGTPTLSMAQNGDAWGDHNAWARFEVGSWKQVRVFTETLDKSGQVESTSTTETKTTLVEVNETTYTLKLEVTVEVAGRRFTAEPKYVTQGFNGETSGQSVSVKQLGQGEVVIDGHRYPCAIRQITIDGKDTKRVSSIYYSDQVAPYLLKRESKVTDKEGKVSSYESAVEVVAVDMPYKVLTEIKSTSHVKTVHKQARGAETITLEVHCADVPGGVVSHTAKEIDETGRIVRRSTLELVEYEVVKPQVKRILGRRRLFHHIRPRSD